MIIRKRVNNNLRKGIINYLKKVLIKNKYNDM
jgi:hypothetical protein